MLPVETRSFDRALRDAYTRAQLSQTELASLLSDIGIGEFSQQTISNWSRGQNRPQERVIYLALGQILFRNGGLRSRQEIAGFLRSADQGDLHKDELAMWFPELAGQRIDTVEIPPAATYPTTSPLAYPWVGVPTFWQATIDTMNNLFRWDEIPEYMQQSWTSKFLYAFSSLVQRVTVERLWAAVRVIVLFFTAFWLMAPMLRWPVPDPAARARAALLWASISLFLPALIAWLTRPDGWERFQPLDQSKSYTLLLLKLAGAYNGFHVIALPAFFTTLTLAYLGLGPVPDLLLTFFVIMALLFTYVAARTTPAMRFQMFGDLRLHEFDPTFLVIFASLGPLLALAFYFGYKTLVQPLMGPLLLLTMVAFLFWEYRKKHPEAVSDPVMILLYGLVLPAFYFLVVFFGSEPAPALSLTDLVPLGTFVAISLIETLMFATLLVRRPPTLTIRGLLGLMAAGLLVMAVLQWAGLLAGRIVFTLVILAAILTRTHYRRYLSFHRSFGLLQLLLLFFLALWQFTTLPLWLIALPGAALAALLLLQAY